MKTKTIHLYEFDELNDTAKERARQWYREGALDYDWWDYLYEDAERVGLEIIEFDLDRNKHVTGKLVKSAEESIAAILSEHGKDCETYRMAEQFQKGLSLLEKESEDYDEEHDTLEEEYREALCEEYASLLQQEYEYLLSDECVDETIKANEYTFTEAGKRMD